MGITLNSGIHLQEQHQKETAAPDTEFIVLPPNTQAKHVPTSYGLVNVQQFKSEYENEISAILFTPSLSDSGGRVAAQNTGTSAAACTAPQSTHCRLERGLMFAASRSRLHYYQRMVSFPQR